MDRKSKILMMALSRNKKDDNVLHYLQTSKYESTKGLNASEIKIILSDYHKLLNENKSSRCFSATPYSNGYAQIKETSSIEKIHGTRFQVEKAKRHNGSEDCDRETIDTNTLVDETDPYEDSGDEYVPDSDETSDSETDSDSQNFFSKALNKKLNIDNEKVYYCKSSTTHIEKRTCTDKRLNHNKNKNYGELDISNHNNKGINTVCNLENISDDNLDIEIKVQNEIILQGLDTNFCSSYENFNQYNKIANIEYDQHNLNLDIQKEVSNLRKPTAKRVWNKKDYCFFCDTDVIKFSRHVLRRHSAEIEVQEILAFKVRDKRRKHLFNKLRNKGNFIKSSNAENVVPVRKPALGNPELPTASTFLPCKYCKGYYKKKYLYRHVKKCPHNNDDKTIKVNAQSEGQSLLSAYKKNDILRKEIFPNMRPDAISFTAKTDPLICAVAVRYLKSHRDKQFRLVASRKMRQLAALLIEVKKKTKVKCLLDALNPLNFDILVECTKIIAKYDNDSETYGAPSLATQMGTELKDCIDVAYNMSIKKFRKETENTNQLKILKDLIISEWRYEVSTIANNNLQQKKWNKPSLIPLAEDLTLLKTYLHAKGAKCRNALQLKPDDEKAFKTLVEITYVQLLLLNRRRVGELQRMTVISYTTNINNQNSIEFDSCISESEKVLMRGFKRVVIRGKRGRGVPVLFTEEMVQNTNLLLQLRQNFVRQKNIYLFPNTKSSTSISGTKTLYNHVRFAGVKTRLL
ncbi:hypothetical protein RN001_001453 [Aquatica leii]|uniref:Uncharacterized protein n=1 Tax=Aquatica leii TaxID=1421715 RepID=A0AAN7SJK6_9COLE|nr:hypothetical protein RN001_001453 [Aquatica leii]